MPAAHEHQTDGEKLSAILATLDAVNQNLTRQNGSVARLWERSDGTERRIGDIELRIEKRFSEIQTTLTRTESAVESIRTVHAAEQAAEEKAAAPMITWRDRAILAAIYIVAALVLVNAKDMWAVFHKAIGG